MKFVLALLMALATGPALAQDHLTLMLDWYVNPDHGPIVIAQEKGYFADEDLEVELVEPSNPADPPKMVAAGRADLAIGYQPQLSLALDKGLPLLRVGTLVATPLDCLMTRADGPIERIEDLKGKTVGFSVAGVEEAVLDGMLKEHGLSLDDVNLVNVNFSLVPSLLSGQVDAVMGAFRNFELNQMEIEGAQGRCFFPEEHGVPAYDALVYLANGKTLDRAVVARFLRATERATEFIVNHPDESYDIFAGTKAELDNDLNERAWADTIPRFALRPAALDHGRYRRMEAFLARHELISSEKPVSDMAIDVSAEQ